MSETLYNGIELPDAWPPDYDTRLQEGLPPWEQIEERPDAPMRTPYLENPPPVIPIDVGRQLFVDDFLVAETTLERVFHKPVRYGGNPVLKPETARELEYPSVGLCHGGVFWNPERERYEMFYHAGELHTQSLHLAVSRDLIHWERPDLGLGRGNCFLPAGPWSGPDLKTAGTCFAVWRDAAAANPAERYKMLTLWGHYKDTRPPDPARVHSLCASPDGIHWGNAVLCGYSDDAQSFFHNPFRKVWVYSIKRFIRRRGWDGRLRARYYFESPDFLAGKDWDRQVYWTCADRLDLPEPADGYAAHPSPGAPCQLYVLHGAAYESIMLGMHEIHRGPENEVCRTGGFPKLTDLEISFSRDGFHWHRPDRTGFIRGTRRLGDWDRAYLHSTTSVCVVHGDQLVFPYMGFSGTDPDGGNPGFYRGGSIGMAMLRRDGFASLRAGGEQQSLLTRPVTFSGKHLFVNVDNPNGLLRVEICAEDGKPVPGFALADCLPLAVNTTTTPVRWKQGDSLARFSGQPVRFRFQLTRGNLYAFWVSSSPQGESGGCHAANSPQFTGGRDV